MKLPLAALRQIFASGLTAASLTLLGFFDSFPGVGIDIQILTRAAASREHYPYEENGAAE